MTFFWPTYENEMKNMYCDETRNDIMKHEIHEANNLILNPRRKLCAPWISMLQYNQVTYSERSKRETTYVGAKHWRKPSLETWTYWFMMITCGDIQDVTQIDDLSGVVGEWPTDRFVVSFATTLHVMDYVRCILIYRYLLNIQIINL